VGADERNTQGILKRIMAAAIILSLMAPAGIAEAHHKAPKPLPCPQWHKALKKHGLPVKTFAPIMMRESKCIRQAIGWNYHKGKSHRDCKLSHARTYRHCKAVRSYDVGLLQINSSWKSVTAKICKTKLGDMLALQDASCNLKVAAYLYKNGGLHHWRGTSGRSTK
jgi:hypothetical protein